VLSSPELEDSFERFSRAKTEEQIADVILGDPIYGKRFKVPMMNGPQLLVRSPIVATRLNTSIGITTSKEAHRHRAEFFNEAAKKFDDEWQQIVTEARQLYGDQGPLVSGVFRSHFPEYVKARLRFLTQAHNLCQDAAQFHQHLSKSRSPLFR
jgi:hypothetical protein